MRRTLASGLMAALIVPAMAWAQPPTPAAPPPNDLGLDQHAPPRDAPDQPPGELLRPSEDRGPQPGDPAPPPAPSNDRDDKAKSKPKLDEAAGGVAGGVAAQVAGTAVAGPVGGLAAGAIGAPVGSAVVRTGKKLLGMGKKSDKTEQAAAAPDQSRPAADRALDRDGPVLGDSAPAPTHDPAPSDEPRP